METEEKSNTFFRELLDADSAEIVSSANEKKWDKTREQEYVEYSLVIRKYPPGFEVRYVYEKGKPLRFKVT